MTIDFHAGVRVRLKSNPARAGVLSGEKTGNPASPRWQVIFADRTDFVPGPVHLCFEVADLDHFLDRAKSLGAQLHPSHPEPFTPPVPEAGRIAYLLGPDGEEVEVREPD